MIVDEVADLDVGVVGQRVSWIQGALVPLQELDRYCGVVAG